MGTERVLEPPVGSGCAGNISVPHMDHTATAVTRPVKAANVRVGSITRARDYVPKKVD
jgi:hypothetical protein